MQDVNNLKTYKVNFYLESKHIKNHKINGTILGRKYYMIFICHCNNLIQLVKCFVI